MFHLQEIPKKSAASKSNFEKPEKSLPPGILAEKKKPSARQGSTMNFMPLMLSALATTQTSMPFSPMLGR